MFGRVCEAANSQIIMQEGFGEFKLRKVGLGFMRRLERRNGLKAEMDEREMSSGAISAQRPERVQ